MNATTSFNLNDTYSEQVPALIAALMRVNSLAVMLLNSMVLACLILRQNSVPNVYWMQLMCLSLNDVIAGFSVFIVSFTDREIFAKNLAVCCGTCAFFISSQASTLYGILTIGVVRVLILRKARFKGLQTKWRLHHILIFCLATLSFSFLTCLIPFLIWAGRNNRYLQHVCSMEAVFGDNLSLAMKVLVAMFLIPLITTNILYGIVFGLLRSVRKKVIPQTREMDTHIQQSGATVLHQNTRQADTRPIKECNTKEKKHSKNDMLSGTELREYKIGQPNSIESNPDEDEPSNVSNEATTRFDHKTQGTLVDTTNTTHINVASTSQNLGPMGNSVHSGVHSSTPKNIKKAYALLGLIILFLNLCSWPGVLMLMMESMTDSWTLNRAVKFPIFTTISCNALVNPILYAIQIAEFRRALKSLLVDCARCF